MNSLIKIGVAGALALGGTVAAHAGITAGSSSGSTGDVVLFADVYSGNTLVDAYVGDTGISVDSIGSGTKPTTTTPDSTYQTFLTDASASGVTVEWALMGGGAHSGPAPSLVSTGTMAEFGKNLTGGTLGDMGTDLYNFLPTIPLGSATEGNFNTTSSIGGTGFQPGAQASDVSNWFNLTSDIATTGLNTQAELYLLSAASEGGAVAANISGLFNVELTSSGLVFSALSSGGSVPLPGAIWLLGSGLMGLAGVARRKANALNLV